VTSFRFGRAQEVVFRDLDLHGHVNSAVYSTYLETARLAYLKDVARIEPGDGLWIILADLRMSFRSPASLGELLNVGVSVTRMGSKSMEFAYEISGADGQLVLEATSVHVTFDYERDATAPLLETWRRAITEYESADREREENPRGGA